MTDREREILKKRIREKLSKNIERKNKMKLKITPPRYDEVYFKGVEWLDSL